MQHVLDRFTLRSSPLLDAAVSGVTGLLLLAGAGPLHRSLDLPTVFLRVSGAILVPFVIMLIVLGAQNHPARSAIRSVIALNLLWTAGSFIVLLSGQIEPNAPGVAFVIFQAVVVALFAALQFVALDRRYDADAIHVAQP